MDAVTQAMLEQVGLALGDALDDLTLNLQDNARERYLVVLLTEARGTLSAAVSRLESAPARGGRHSQPPLWA